MRGLLLLATATVLGLFVTGCSSYTGGVFSASGSTDDGAGMVASSNSEGGGSGSLNTAGGHSPSGRATGAGLAASSNR